MSWLATLISIFGNGLLGITIVCGIQIIKSKEEYLLIGTGFIALVIAVLLIESAIMIRVFGIKKLIK